MSRDAAPVYSIRQSTAAVPTPLAVYRRSFWQRPVAQNILPLAVSLLFHSALIVAGLWGLSAYRNMSQPREHQIIIPDAAILPGAPVGGIPNPGLGGDPHLAAGQNVDANVTASDSWAESRSESLTNSLMAGGSNESADSVIGLGPRAGITGATGASSPGGSTALAPFGMLPGGGIQRPRSQFMGISGNAERIVYLCDVSGSMMSVFPRMRTEIHNAIDVLRPSQAFNLIMFSETFVALDNDALLVANPRNKRKAYELADRLAAPGPHARSTDPLAAIRLAFKQKPQLIYVLTDGFENVDGGSFDSVIDEFRKLNADKQVKVNTIMIRGGDNPELETVVKTIAAENGGVCRIIDRQDM